MPGRSPFCGRELLQEQPLLQSLQGADDQACSEEQYRKHGPDRRARLHLPTARLTQVSGRILKAGDVTGESPADSACLRRALACQ